jgi:quercetin dioxygenase-like cupin family protein
MRRVCVLLLTGSIAGTAFYHLENVSATSPKGYTTVMLAEGQFGILDVANVFARGPKAQENEHPGLSANQPSGMSDVYVQSNAWAPGGDSGWHTHPGKSLIFVTAGTVTDYEGYDPDCKPHVYATGMSFADPGGNHIHILRNEGAIEAKTIAVQFIPADTARRIEATDPGNCHF